MFPPVQSATVASEIRGKIDTIRAELPVGYGVTKGGVVEELSKCNEPVFAVIPAMPVVMINLLMNRLRDFSRVAIASLMAPFSLFDGFKKQAVLDPSHRLPNPLEGFQIGAPDELVKKLEGLVKNTGHQKPKLLKRLGFAGVAQW